MDKYTMIFTKTGIAPGSNVEVFQIGKFQEARIVYSEVELVSGGTTSDKVNLAVNDQLGSGLGMILASVTGDTAADYYGDGGASPTSNLSNHIQYTSFFLYYPSKIYFVPPTVSGNTGSYWIQLQMREMQ